MNIRLSDDLRVILDYELAHGNEVAQVFFPEDRVAIVLRYPFRISNADGSTQLIPASVEQWEFDDPHYADEYRAGYRSKESGHVLSAPPR